MENNRSYSFMILNAILGLCLLITVFMSVNLYNKHKEFDETKNEIEQMKLENKNIKMANKKVDKKQEKINEELGIDRVSNQSETFNNLFFEWDTWEKFSNNMETIRKDYPAIQKGNVVNVDGKDVGTGNSPVSSYSADVFTTKEKNEVNEFITQRKTYDDKKTETIWQKNSVLINGEYDIKRMKSYELII
ncbi:hypothetical protein SSCS72_02834 [Mammaliicoccus sciuri]|jgi:hypothetical protein|uniref:hypothetical protein n=1 Tax=Mammaliicoccus sciuri TaxID=1296 RepID=UPI001EF71B14|nr:hypothetical protein [Mammaliicoccus sciuri]CAG7915013.1 hypothetical protein SSCS72_02834 [Mammaliicoccus sciuri]